MRNLFKYKINMVVAFGILFTLLCLLFSYNVSTAADATFSWTPNDETPSGYKIHYGTASGIYEYQVDVGLPDNIDNKHIGTVTGLEEGITYYFAATAYTETAESDYSTEVIYTVPLKTSIIPEPPMVFGFNRVVLYTADGTKRITIEADGTIKIEDIP